jgi:hypothetical protein
MGVVPRFQLVMAATWCWRRSALAPDPDGDHIREDLGAGTAATTSWSASSLRFSPAVTCRGALAAKVFVPREDTKLISD